MLILEKSRSKNDAGCILFIPIGFRLIVVQQRRLLVRKKTGVMACMHDQLLLRHSPYYIWKHFTPEDIKAVLVVNEKGVRTLRTFQSKLFPSLTSSRIFCFVNRGKP